MFFIKLVLTRHYTQYGRPGVMPDASASDTHRLYTCHAIFFNLQLLGVSRVFV